MGQQDKAEQVTDVLSKVMNYIEPFQQYLDPDLRFSYSI